MQKTRILTEENKTPQTQTQTDRETLFVITHDIFGYTQNIRDYLTVELFVESDTLGHKLTMKPEFDIARVRIAGWVGGWNCDGAAPLRRPCSNSQRNICVLPEHNLGVIQNHQNTKQDE